MKIIFLFILHPSSFILSNGQGGIRTPVVLSTSGLQPDAIGRSATCPPLAPP